MSESVDVPSARSAARPSAFKELVLAAERCPVSIIHPGTPLNPKEKGLEKLIARAAPFN